MRVLVTGATGFIGSHTIRTLLDAGHSVRALYRRQPGSLPPSPPLAPLQTTAHLEWVSGDVLEPATLAIAAAGCEAVIHTAAVLRTDRAHAELQRAINVDGTRHVLAAAVAAGARRVVFTSSIAAIGAPPPGQIADEQQRYDWPPGLPYNESKRDSERLALAAVGSGLEVVVLSPAWVLGPEAPRAHQRRLLQAMRSGLALLAPAGGTTICDVRDVAEAHVAALGRGRSGERYILGGPRISYRELWRTFAEAVGGPTPVATLPALAMRVLALPLVAVDAYLPLPAAPRLLAAYSVERYYSSAKAVAELGYHERPAAETVADMVSWYRSAGKI